MRVIAGKYRSRILVAPPGWDTRPTSDRLRETLFNILGPRIAQAVFVDLFAGTGAVGIEALSRGAAQVYFAETAKPALTALRKNLHALIIEQGCAVETRGALPLLRVLEKQRTRADIVFLDPPYADAEAYKIVLRALATSSILHPESVVIVEHSSHIGAPEPPAPLCEYRTLKQGEAQVTFYRKSEISASGDVEIPEV